MGLSVACYPVAMVLGRRNSGARDDDVRQMPSQVFAERVRVPWKLTITTVLWTATYGMLSAVFNEERFWSPYGLGAYVAGALILSLCLLRSRLNFNDLIYKVGFMGAAVGMAILLFSHELLLSGYCVFMASCRFVELLIWGLFAHLTSTRGLLAYWTTALNVGIWTLGRFVGFWVATTVLDTSAVVPNGAPYVVILTAELVVLVGALFLSSRSNYAEGWGVEHVPGASPSERQIEHCCRVLSAEHGLTQREAEVLELLAKGATRPEISERLYISLETSKTHVRHVYQKIGVGSREDVAGVIGSMIDAAWEC